MTIPPGATSLSDEDPTPEELRAFADKAMEIAPKLRALLYGLPHQVQGAILADLLATFVGGFYPESVRDEVLSAHILGVIAMMKGQAAAKRAAENAAEAAMALARAARQEKKPGGGPAQVN